VTTRQITLSDEHEAVIQQALESGRYLSESEVVAEALREFRVHEAIRQAKMEELRAKIQVGVEQANRGEFVELNAEDVKAQGRKRLGIQ
jgi:antitoxin ParD1/3/4